MGWNVTLPNLLVQADLIQAAFTGPLENPKVGEAFPLHLGASIHRVGTIVTVLTSEPEKATNRSGSGG
jgi:hypothetical protein